MESNKIKCYEITPSPNTEYDSTIIPAGDSWDPALELASQSLESQLLRADDDGSSWSDFSVSIKCVMLTQEELDQLED